MVIKKRLSLRKPRFTICLIFLLVEILSGCGFKENQKRAVEATIKGCNKGNTISISTTIGTFNSSVSATCTWVSDGGN